MHFPLVSFPIFHQSGNLGDCRGLLREVYILGKIWYLYWLAISCIAASTNMEIKAAFLHEVNTGFSECSAVIIASKKSKTSNYQCIKFMSAV